VLERTIVDWWWRDFACRLESDGGGWRRSTSMEITTYSLSPYIPVVVFKKAPDFLIKSKTFNSMGK
jgi:hypothetical protein